MKKTRWRCWQCYWMTIDLNTPFGFAEENELADAELFLAAFPELQTLFSKWILKATPQPVFLFCEHHGYLILDCRNAFFFYKIIQDDRKYDFFPSFGRNIT